MQAIVAAVIDAVIQSFIVSRIISLQETLTLSADVKFLMNTLNVQSPQELRPPQVTRRRALGVGLRSFTGGLGFIAKNPEHWPLALVPIGVMAALSLGLSALGWFGSVWVAHAVALTLGIESAGLVTALRLLAFVLMATGGFLVALGVAQPLSGEALEALCRRQERALTGREWPNQPWLPQLFRSLRVTLTSLVLAGPLLLVLTVIELFTGGVGAVVIEPIKFVIAGWMVAWDLLDYPLSVRGVAVRDRIAWMRARKWYVLGFGMSAAAILLIPVVGLLLLPAGAAGAARLVVHLDQGEG